VAFTIPGSVKPPLQEYFDAMFAALGPQHWWPSSKSGGPFEVIVGAILTQSTAWTNVERAVANLRRERLLTPRAIARVPLARLARLVRPSGYFNQKARKLRAFVRFLRREYGGSLARMFRTPTAELREKLLAVHGIGPETADSILLYAGNHPVFVVDAYTRRILLRHELIQESINEKRKTKTGTPGLVAHVPLRQARQGAAEADVRPSPQNNLRSIAPQASRWDLSYQPGSYEQMRALFEANLPRDPQLYNEFHALLVNVGKNWCRPREPKCESCPLQRFLPDVVAHVPFARDSGRTDVRPSPQNNLRSIVPQASRWDLSYKSTK